MARCVGERPFLDTVVTVANTTSWYCALLLLVILFVSSLSQENRLFEAETVHGDKLMVRPCDEIYVVGEGETLHTISDKCGDPFIVERNPHIHDPDDVFPGLVIKITPSKPFER